MLKGLEVFVFELIRQPRGVHAIEGAEQELKYMVFGYVRRTSKAVRKKSVNMDGLDVELVNNSFAVCIDVRREFLQCVHAPPNETNRQK